MGAAKAEGSEVRDDRRCVDVIAAEALRGRRRPRPALPPGREADGGLRGKDGGKKEMKTIENVWSPATQSRCVKGNEDNRKCLVSGNAFTLCSEVAISMNVRKQLYLFGLMRFFCVHAMVT